LFLSFSFPICICFSSLVPSRLLSFSSFIHSFIRPSFLSPLYDTALP
jgi:hypothetical protein